MSKLLVAYFSASGITAAVAKTLAESLSADLYEIAPETPYTKQDLNWLNPKSRSSVEMKNPTFRPPLASGQVDISPYDSILLGFPIWWYIAPTIVNTFLEGLELSGKKILLFATSGGSGFGKTVEKLAPSCPGAKLVEGNVFRHKTSFEEISVWAKSLAL